MNLRIIVLLMGILVAGSCAAQQLHLETKLQAPVSISYVTTCGSGAEFVGIGEDGGLYRWATPTSTAHRIATEAEVVQLACSMDGKRIAAALSNGAVAVVNDEEKVEQKFNVTKRYIGSVSFSPDAALLTVTASDSPTQLWDVRSGQQIAVGRTTLGASAATAFSPDGKSYVSADEDTTIRAYSSKGEPLYSAEAGLLEPFTIAYTPDGKEFVVAGASGTLILFDATTGKKLKTSEARGNPIRNAMVSPNGQTVAVLEFDDFKFVPVRISLWNANSNRWEPNTIDPKGVIGAGTDKAHLLLMKSEGPKEISVLSVQ